MSDTFHDSQKGPSIVESITNRIGGLGMVVSGFFLMAVMLVIVGNVIMRLFGGIIAGTYELVQVFIVCVIGFAMSYGAQKGIHVVVDFIFRLFPKRIQRIMQVLIFLVCLITWALIAWASIIIIPEKIALDERTPLLNITVIPFRFIWSISLIVLCLQFFKDLFISMSRGFRK